MENLDPLDHMFWHFIHISNVKFYVNYVDIKYVGPIIYAFITFIIWHLGTKSCHIYGVTIVLIKIDSNWKVHLTRLCVIFIKVVILTSVMLKRQDCKWASLKITLHNRCIHVDTIIVLNLTATTIMFCFYSWWVGCFQPKSRERLCLNNLG